jgi:RNA polymerase sigma factor (sigma-70 family)
MDYQQDLAQAFEANRERLTSMATRILGSRADAEDAVQETWVRLARQPPGAIENLAAWLTTVVGRVSIDVLRSRSTKAEVPYELRPDEIRVAEDDTSVNDPQRHAVHADELSLALLVVLGALQPEERLAFVLHDLFAVPFAEIGTILDKSADAAKMSASRARRKVREAGAEATTSTVQTQRAVVDAFLIASREGDFEQLLRILDPDLTVEIHTAHGISVHTGTDHLVSLVKRGDPSRITARRVLVNGRPGILAWTRTGRAATLMSCTVEHGKITKILSIVDPRQLALIDLPPM